MNKTDSSVQTNESILRRRWRKFKTLKRGYYSLVILSCLYGISFFLPFLINNRALVVKYHGEYYFPVLSGYTPGKQFGQDVPGDTRYRKLKVQFKEQNEEDSWVWMPPYPYSPYEDITFEGNKPYEPPSRTHWLGTDNTGRDVFARLCYAFNISISFALLLTIINYIIGVLIGGTMGYYGGKFDLFFQRLIEIWSSLPMLFVIIILSSIFPLGPPHVCGREVARVGYLFSTQFSKVAFMLLYGSPSFVSGHALS